jgi:hypothetical protein
MSKKGKVPSKGVAEMGETRGSADVVKLFARFGVGDEVAPFDTPEFRERLGELIEATRLSWKRGRVTAAPLHAEDVLLEVAAAASNAGHEVDFVPYNEKKLSQGYWHTALLIDGQLCFIQHVTNAQSRPHRKQVYAHTGVHLAALEKYAVMIFFVTVPGYEQMTLVVPTADMRKLLPTEFSASKKDDRISLYIPLAYRPSHPVLDFLAYQDAWNAVPGSQGGNDSSGAALH